MIEKILSTRDAVMRFLRWWGSELKSCASDLMNQVAPRWRRPLVFYAVAERLIVLDPNPASEKPLAEVARANFRAPFPAQLPEGSAIALAFGRRARLIVNSAQAFTRTLRLPLAAVPHLRSAVALQLPKLLPMDPSLLVSDFQVAKKEAEKGLIHIELAALKRTEVQIITQAIAAWGFRLSKVQLADSLASDPRFDFVAGAASAGNVALRPTDRYWIGAAAALGLACVAVGATESYRADKALAQAKQQTSSTAATAMQRQQRLLSKLEPLVALSQLARAPTAASILTEITTLIPHDTWLTTFEIKDRRVRLVGISPNPAALVRFLNASLLLNDFELRSSMSAGVGTEKDRFEITAELKDPSP